MSLEGKEVVKNGKSIELSKQLDYFTPETSDDDLSEYKPILTK